MYPAYAKGLQGQRMGAGTLLFRSRERSLLASRKPESSVFQPPAIPIALDSATLFFPSIFHQNDGTWLIAHGGRPPALPWKLCCDQ